MDDDLLNELLLLSQQFRFGNAALLQTRVLPLKSPVIQLLAFDQDRIGHFHKVIGHIQRN